MLMSWMTFTHLPRPVPLTYPFDGVSLKLKGDRDSVAEVVPGDVPAVCRGCGLKGQDRPSIRAPGTKEGEGGTSPCLV